MIKLTQSLPVLLFYEDLPISIFFFRTLFLLKFSQVLSLSLLKVLSGVFDVKLFQLLSLFPS